MRIANKILTDRFAEHVNSTLDKINRYNNQIATGKKVNKSSDAPDDISLILQFKRAVANLDQYSKNIDAGLSFMRVTDNALLASTEQVRLARKLAIEAANDPTLFSDSSIQGIVTDLAGIKEEIRGQANTQLAGKYVFSGYSTKTKTYSDTSNGYRGDTFDILTKIANDKTVPTNITGDVAFRESSLTGEIADLSKPVGGLINLYDSTVPEAAGKLITAFTPPGLYTGVSSGNYRVEVQTANTTVGEVGGLVLELIFNDGTVDTVIDTVAAAGGTAATETINFVADNGLTFFTAVDMTDATQTMAVGNLANSFDAAGDVRFTISDGTNTSAEVIFSAGVTYTQTQVETVINAAIAAGTPAAATINFSFDSNGKPVFEIDPRDASGTMEFTDTSIGTNPTTKGRLFDMFSVTTGYKNIFGVMDDLIAAVNSKDQGAVELQISRLDNAEAAILKSESIVGARERSLENNQSHLQTIRDERVKLLSNLEDADPTEAITKLTNQQNAYESILFYGALLQRTSLLDFLR